MAAGKLRWLVRGVLLVLLLGACMTLAEALGFRFRHRIDDRAGLLDRRQLPYFEDYLSNIEAESGVDVRFIFVDSVPRGLLEEFTVQRARALGIGRKLDRRSVLLAYDVSRRRLRIEIGPTLQGIFTDAFVGYVMRNHVRNFFAAGDPNIGLRLTLRLLQMRLRRAAMGEEYDPRPAEYIEDAARLASGGGAASTMPVTGQGPSFNTAFADPTARQRFEPQATAEGTFRRYLELLRGGRLYTDAPLFTQASQSFLATFPATPAYTEAILLEEYGRAYRILERGDFALLYFTDDPFISPHLFRRGPAGWQLDIAAELRDTREYTGAPLTWAMLQQDDEYTRAFIDRYILVGPLLRVAGGDNRLLPVRARFVPGFGARPGMDLPRGLEQLTVAEAAARIDSAEGKPVVVLLYSIGDRASRGAFPAIVELLHRCEASGAVVLAFSMDDDWNAVRELPGFLQGARAPFPAVHLHRWPLGQLRQAMAPLDIRIASSWMHPLAAIRDRHGRTVAQAEGLASEVGATRLAELGAACDALTH